jgi:hypothetical protein
MSHAEAAYVAEGYSAHRAGLPQAANPYSRWSTAWVAWASGWERSSACPVKPKGAPAPAARVGATTRTASISIAKHP